jgi:hypothetical protein
VNFYNRFTKLVVIEKVRYIKDVAIKFHSIILHVKPENFPSKIPTILLRQMMSSASQMSSIAGEDGDEEEAEVPFMDDLKGTNLNFSVAAC